MFSKFSENIAINVKQEEGVKFYISRKFMEILCV